VSSPFLAARQAEEEHSVPLLHLSSVAKSYMRGYAVVEVLRDVSLTIAAGRVVAVFGRPRSGKTTLLRIAAGLESPDAGEVAFGGRGIAWIQAERPHAGQLPVYEHVALALYREIGPRRARRHARDTLADMGLAQHAGERWSDLSDATRVLCSIAAAKARRPSLLVADDPTAGLGTVDRGRVCGALRVAAERDGIGVLMAVPDMPAMVHADDVRLLNRGRLLAPSDRPQGGATVVELPDGRRSA
jgi:ABC-type multidrug transport system ATPase subunit